MIPIYVDANLWFLGLKHGMSTHDFDDQSVIRREVSKALLLFFQTGIRNSTNICTHLLINISFIFSQFFFLKNVMFDA